MTLHYSNRKEGSDTALQQATQAKDSTKAKAPKRVKLATLFHAQDELYDVLLKLHDIKKLK